MTTPAYDDQLDRVPLLLHFDGNWQDSSPAGRTLTTGNGALARETGGVFGSGCADFTAATNAWARTDTSMDLALSGDFGLELQYKPTELEPGTYFLLATPSLAGNVGPYLWMYVGAGGNLQCHVLGYDTGAIGALTLNQYNSIQLLRAGDVAGIWLNGVQGWSQTMETSVSQPMLWQFGSLPPTFANSFQGGRCLIDEVRLTIGASRQPGLQTGPFANEAAPAVWPSICQAWPAGRAFPR